MISQYDIINYATFNPLSMQEIFTPVSAMREQHDKLAEEYAAQNTATSLSLLGLKEGVDDEAIKIQKSLIDETRKAADELATKGFNESGRRKNLYGLKQRYNSEVVPLQNQLKIRQERAEELRRMQLQDPTFRATMNPSEIGLTAGLKNPEAFNYDGVSGNQLYKSVAEKANQLSKVIEQEHPELMKSGLAYQYFTLVKSGADLSQIDAAMRQQFNPKDVDKMTSLMHGIISSTMNEFGVPQKFANNKQIQDELWSTASQGLYAAAGQKNFGSMSDSYGMQIDAENRARQAAIDAAEPPGKTHMEYDAAFDEKNFKEIDNLVNNANNIKTKTDVPYGELGTPGGAYSYNSTDWLKNEKQKNSSQQELFKLAKAAGISLPAKIAAKDLPAINNQIAEALKEQYRTANKSRHFFNPSNETVQKFTAALSSTKDIVDINGDKIDRAKIFSTDGKLIGDSYLVRGVNGATTLKTTDKEGNQVSIPFDISKLGSTQLQTLDRDVRTLTDEQIAKRYDQPGLTKQDLEDEIDRILTSEQYTQTKSQSTNPGYTPYGTR